MFKSRYGNLYETVRGQEWRWEIENWSSKYEGKIMDSELMISKPGVEFHFHLTVDRVGPDEIIGFFIHHKRRPIPKYTYAIGNTKGFVAKQQTAHTIPGDTERCGHQKVVSNFKLRNIIQKAGDDVCVIWFRFDEDTIRSSGNIGEQVWTIPSFHAVRIGPYTSGSFNRLGQEDKCTLKLDVDPTNRANVIPHVSSNNKRDRSLAALNVPCLMKFTTPSQRILFSSGECGPGRWPSIPYASLLNLDSDKTLLISITFIQTHIRRIEPQQFIPQGSQQQNQQGGQQPKKVPDIAAVLPPPGMRQDAEGNFNYLVEDDEADNMEPGPLTEAMSEDGMPGPSQPSHSQQPVVPSSDFAPTTGDASSSRGFASQDYPPKEAAPLPPSGNFGQD